MRQSPQMPPRPHILCPLQAKGTFPDRGSSKPSCCSCESRWGRTEGLTPAAPHAAGVREEAFVTKDLQGGFFVLLENSLRPKFLATTSFIMGFLLQKC